MNDENERIHIKAMEARIRLWREGDISDEDLALELDYMVPELKRCYEKIDAVNQLVCLLDELLDTDNMTFSEREEIGDASLLWRTLTSYFFEG
jgi:hypothetical protein